MSSDGSEAEAWEKVWKLVGDIGTAMMTSVDGHHLRSRPMRGHVEAERREVWFFTKASAHKTNEIAADNQVALTYADPRNEDYVSLSGSARLVRDRERIERYWSPFVAAWFPQGKDDPDLALVGVSVEQAEYWDSPSSRMVQLVQIARATLTGREPNMGESRKL